MTVLYHATFSARLPSIREHGLGARQFKNWEISEDGKLYFATDPYVAESFCEAAEDVENDIYDSGIVVLQVDSSCLDPELLCPDGNQKEECNTIAYKGIVPYERLHIWNDDK